MSDSDALFEYSPSSMDDKVLWRRSSPLRIEAVIVQNFGRQQQEGKKDYLKALFSWASDLNHSVAKNVLSICRHDDSQEHLVIYFTIEDQFATYDLKRFTREHFRYTAFHPEKLLEEGFLVRSQRLEKNGSLDAALDLLYDRISYELRNKRYEVIDDWLKGINVQNLSTDLALGILTATLPAKNRLNERSNFFLKVEEHIKKIGDWTDDLLIGLES